MDKKSMSKDINLKNVICVVKKLKGKNPENSLNINIKIMIK